MFASDSEVCSLRSPARILSSSFVPTPVQSKYTQTASLGFLSRDQASQACTREFNVQCSFYRREFHAEISRVQKSGIFRPPWYFYGRWTLDSPGRQEGLPRGSHSQSNRRFGIGDIRQSERIEGYCLGNVFANKVLIYADAFCDLFRGFRRKQIE